MDDEEVRVSTIPPMEKDLARLIAEHGINLNLFDICDRAEDFTERLKKALSYGRFEIKGGYQEEPPELANLDKDAEVILREGGIDTIVRADYAMRAIRDVIDRQNKEHFTFNEIAIILAEKSGADVDYIRNQQRKAFEDGRLVFFRHGLPVDPETYDDYMGVWGFDCEYSTPEKINNWLLIWGAEYKFHSKSEVPQEKHKPRGQMQDDAIISWLKLNDYNPLALPKNKQGVRGVKADCKVYLLAKRRDLFTENSFATAWKRLADKKGERIIYSKN
ncbi:hypothetical protein G3485_04020 [Shewanella baltica]|uniref:hypothetical protein n=1 Tax=Shewanella baltica TaxID=62322 RepID=UPI00217EC41C|nr:hypothetical protein [Shewanella baltica]MCS6125861.1 hypothetical protein [Shewanella baltica]MCS6138025.1 hypothetical protein [Shewanella baltica]MCS6143894.1 hypothetical protein [Shewanella baltica]MCS6168651.1 hypothetical protein [Shewanella baltica]MCS6185853.1 hypothetical protein [Shewanella baltica]